MVVVILETLGPKVSRITEHGFASLEQHRMIVGGENGKPRFDRQIANADAHPGQFGSIGKSIAGRGQAAEQTNETGTEKDDANQRPGSGAANV